MITDVFLDQKIVNVCEHMVKMAAQIIMPVRGTINVSIAVIVIDLEIKS